jgi:integrase
LAGARQLAAEINRKRAAGIDVIAEKKRVQTTAAENTFGSAVLRFIEEHAKKHNRTWAATARMLGIVYSPKPTILPGSLCDVWGSRPLSDITDDDLFRLLEQCEKRGVPGWVSRRKGESPAVASLMHATLNKFFRWSIGRRLLRASPIERVQKPSTPRPRDRVLTDIEIGRFWAACGTLGEPFGPLCKILLLTGQRIGEVAGMTQSEFSSDGAVWTIPASRSKNKRTHVVPLPTMAQEILASVRRIAGKPGYIFTTTGRSPVSGFSKTKARLDVALGETPPWVLHDLRRTVATGMADLGTAPHIVEAVLNHVSGYRAGVAGVYNRAAYADEKRVALERWAAHIQTVVAS